MEFFVLVVDDKRNHLDNRVAQLRSDLVRPIRASSLVEAKRKLLESPAIDCVITDINLDGSRNPRNRDGIELKNLARSARPGIPVVGFSAHAANQSLKDDEDFDLWIGKDIEIAIKESLMAEAEELALKHAIGRRNTAKERIARIKAKYVLEEEDIAIIQQLTWSDGGEDNEWPDYSLKVVYSNERPYWHKDGWSLKRPVLVWLRPYKDGKKMVSIYQHPDLQAVGQTDEQAINELFQHLRRIVSDDEEFAKLSPADRSYLENCYSRGD